MTCVALCAAGALAVSGCEKSTAYGEENSLIVVAPDSLWSSVRDTTFAVLEPEFRTTRPEKEFHVTHTAAGSQDFGKLRQWRQVIVFGPPADPLVRKVADAAGAPSPPKAPGILQAKDLWARDQTVTAVVLDPGDPRGSWTSQLDSVAALLQRRYRRFVHERMYVSGVDSALADSLSRLYGFRLTVPRVYGAQVHSGRDTVVIFRNDNPDPSELIRSVLVTWRPKLDSLAPEAAYAWREAVDSVYYNVPQAIDRSVGSSRERQVGGRPALEVTGAWSDESDFPAAGPFVDRLVQCPERTYFLDAWLYAPGKSKYQYVLQLREILDSFRCAPAAAGAD